MLLINLIKSLNKAFGIVCLFFLFSGIYFLAKPTEEEKIIGEQLEMYPLGFHGYSETGEKFVIKQDMKSNIMVNKIDGVHKYETMYAIYDNGKLTGCVLTIKTEGKEKKLTVTVSNDKHSGVSEKYETSTDKDLLYKVVGKTVKKKQFEKILIKMEV